MQGAFDFNPLDVLAAAAALQSANENVPPRDLVYDGEKDESQDEPDEDPRSPSDMKKVCEDFQNSESGVNIAGTSESNSGTIEDVSVKKRGGKKLYSDIYHWNNMHGKDVLRILKEKNHLANISHYLDHSYASFTPHHDLIQKIKELSQSEERGSDSEDNDKTDVSPDQVPISLPNDNCLRMLLTSEQPSDLAQVVRGDATVEQSIADFDVNTLDSEGPTPVTDETVLLLESDINECDHGNENNEEIDCTDNGTGTECPAEICAPAVQDATATGIQTGGTTDLATGDEVGSQCLPDSEKAALTESCSEPVQPGEPVVKETDDAGVMLVTITDSVDNDGSEPTAEHGVESKTESYEADPVPDQPQLPEQTSVGTVLQNGYIHLVEPSTFMPTSQSSFVPQTLLLMGPDGICNSVLIENSQSNPSGNNVLEENTNSKSKILGQAPKVPNVTKLLFETHPTSGAGDASQKQNTSSLKSVCDKNNSWSKLEVSHGDGCDNSPLKGQERFVSVTDTINGIVQSSDQGDGDAVMHLRISGSSLTPHMQPPVQTLLQKSLNRSIPMVGQTCSSLVPSPSKDKLTFPSDSTMKHLRIAGGMVVPCSPNFWDNSSDADSSIDPSNTDSAMTPGLTTTSPSSGPLPTFVPLTSLSQTSPLTSLNIGFSKQNIDIGQVSPVGSDKSRSNLSSPSIASPLTSPRDPSLGGKRNAFMTNKDICIGLNCSSPSESCLLHRGLCIDRPSSVSSQDNSIDGLTDCGSPAPISSIGYQIKHSIAPRSDMRRNQSQLIIDSESNSECDCPSGQSSRNQSPDSKRGHKVHRERISAEHDYLRVFGKPRPPDKSATLINTPPDIKNCQPRTLPLNSELANQLLKLKPSRPSSKNPVGRPKTQRPKPPKLGMLMKRGLYIPTGPLVSDADKRGEHPLKDHDYCLHAFYQAMTFNTVDEGPRRPGPVPKVKVKKEKKKPKVAMSVSDSYDAESPVKRKNKKKLKKLKTERKKKKRKVVVDSPTSAETSEGDEVELEFVKPVNIKKEPIDFSDEGEKEPVTEKDDPLYVPPVGKLADKILRSKDKKVVPLSTRQKDEDRVKVPGTARFQNQFIYFATKKPRRRARPIIGDISKLPQKMFTSQSEFLPGLDSSYIEARSKYLGKLVPEKSVTESKMEYSKSEPFPSMDLPHEHLDLPSDFMIMNDIPHGKLAVGISEEESQFIQSLYNEDQEQPTNEEYQEEIEPMACDLTNEQVHEFLNHFGVEKAMKFLVGESVVEETVETGSPVPPSGDDAHEHMISDKDPHMLPATETESVDMNTDIAVSTMSAITTAAEQALNTTQDTIASIRESLEMETESIKSGTSETHMLPVSASQDSTTRTESIASEPQELDVGTSLQDRNNEVQNDTKPDQKEVLNTTDLGFTNIATDSTPHDLFDLDDDDLLNANLNFVNMNMILNFQSPEKMSTNQRVNENNRNLTKMRKINFEESSNVPSSSLLPSSPLIPKPIDTASIDSDISIDSLTPSSHPIESTRPGRNNPFSIGKPDMFKSGMLNRLHNIPDPTDSGVPELIFVNMFWNDLPGLLINEKEYVRLVDIHKQVLPAKPTGLLKNRCRALKLEFTNCSELQRDFLIRYAHAAASRSTLIVTKAVAETLIGYYVNPPPRSTRADLHEENEAEDVEIERPKFTGGKGKGKGKRSRLNGDKASSQRAKSVDEDSPVVIDDAPLKVTLKLKDCPNYSTLLMPKERLVSYSTSDDSSTSDDDESTESEPEEMQQKRIRKIVTLRRKAKSLRNDILLLTGQVMDDEELPKRKQIYRKRLPAKFTTKGDRSMSGIRSARSSASSSRRSSIDYSRRKMSAKMQKLLLNPEEAQERTKQAIFDIDSTIDEVLGNVRRQCEAEERRGKVVRNMNRTSNIIHRRALPALYKHLVVNDPPGAHVIKKSVSAPSLVTPVLGSTLTSCEKDVASIKMETTDDDGVEIPITLSNKVTQQPIRNTGPSPVSLAGLSSVTIPQSNETSDEPSISKDTVAPNDETFSDSKMTPVLIEIPPELRENTSLNESKSQESLITKQDIDPVEQPSEKHVVTIENFSPTSDRSKFIQPILIQISESNDGVMSINMPITPAPKLVAPNDLDNQKQEEISLNNTVSNVGVGDDKTTENPKVVVESLYPDNNLMPPTLNSRDLTANVQNELDSPSESSSHHGPLRVLHHDTVNNNGKRPSQSGRLYVNMFNDKSSKCIMCTNCGDLFTMENFLCHLHGADTISLLDVKAKHTLDIQNSEPSEWEQTQWQEFKAKCRRFEAETPNDVENNGKNGNKIVKALQFEIIKQANADNVVSDPNVRMSGREAQTDIDSVVSDPNVRHSGRVRKPKQRFSIEEYMFSSVNHQDEESDMKSSVDNVPKKVNREIRKVDSDTSNNKNLVDNISKKIADSYRKLVHENGNIEGKIKRRNRGLENGNNSDMRLSRNHVAKTPVLSKKENTNSLVAKVASPSVKEALVTELRVSSRESTSRFKRLSTSSVTPPANKKQRLGTETRNRSRSRLSTSPARSTRSHLGDKA